MICFSKLHKEVISSLQRALDAVQEMAISQQRYIASLEAMLDRERDERQKLTDKLLQLSGCMPVYAPPAQSFGQQSSEPVSGLSNDIESFIKSAEQEEVQKFADELRREAQELMNAPIQRGQHV